MKQIERIVVALFGVMVAVIAAALPWSPARAQDHDEMPVLPFISPYNSAEPLEDFLVFTAAPRADVPDGQVHWAGQEVPGIDVRGAGRRRPEHVSRRGAGVVVAGRRLVRGRAFRGGGMRGPGNRLADACIPFVRS